MTSHLYDVRAVWRHSCMTSALCDVTAVWHHSCMTSELYDVKPCDVKWRWPAACQSRRSPRCWRAASRQHVTSATRHTTACRSCVHTRGPSALHGPAHTRPPRTATNRNTATSCDVTWRDASDTWRHTPVTLCHTPVTRLSHACRTPVTRLSHACRTPVTHLSHICYTELVTLTQSSSWSRTQLARAAAMWSAVRVSVALYAALTCSEPQCPSTTMVLWTSWRAIASISCCNHAQRGTVSRGAQGGGPSAEGHRVTGGHIGVRVKARHRWTDLGEWYVHVGQGTDELLVFVLQPNPFLLLFPASSHHWAC